MGGSARPRPPRVVLGLLDEGDEAARADDDERGYVAIARARIERWLQVRPELDEAEVLAEAEDVVEGQGSLFG